MPKSTPGSTSRALPGDLSITEVRKERRRALADGRPAPVAVSSTEPECLRDFTKALLRVRVGTLSPHTHADYVTKYRLWVDPDLGHLPLTSIDRRRVEEWLASVAIATGRPTLVGAHRVLRLILEAAVGYSLIPVNPAAKLKLPPADPDADGARRVLSEDELMVLLNHPDQTLRIETMVRAAAEGGLRRAEICGLRWGDVNLNERRIEIRRGYHGQPTKGKRARPVHIGDYFTARLRAWRAESTLGGADAFGGPVWPGRDGGEMAEHTPTQAVMRAVIRAGLVDDEGKPLVTLHGLRHTCASLMLARGVSLIVVSRHLGHRDPQVTAKVYSHLVGDEQLGVAATTFDAIHAQGRPRQVGGQVGGDAR